MNESKKICYVAFERAYNDAGQAARFRVVVYMTTNAWGDVYPNPFDQIWCIMECDRLAVLVRLIKDEFSDHEIHLLDRAVRNAKVVHTERRWGIALVKKLYNL